MLNEEFSNNNDKLPMLRPETIEWLNKFSSLDEAIEELIAKISGTEEELEIAREQVNYLKEELIAREQEFKLCYEESEGYKKDLENFNLELLDYHNRIQAEYRARRHLEQKLREQYETLNELSLERQAINNDPDYDSPKIPADSPKIPADSPKIRADSPKIRADSPKIRADSTEAGAASNEAWTNFSKSSFIFLTALLNFLGSYK